MIGNLGYQFMQLFIAAELNNSEIKLNSASRPFQALKLE